MATSSSSYWEKREEEALKRYITDEKQYKKRLDEIYRNMLDDINKEISGFYGRYAAGGNISIAEAKRRVSKLDIEAYERKAKRYVKDKEFSKQANEEMRLYNATMRINRLEMLKANIGLELISGHNELEKFMGDILQGRTEEELKRQAGILGETINNNAQTANSIVNASFHNAKFSERIWSHQNVLKAELSKLLQTGLIQGKNPNVLARELTKRFDVQRSNAERLMRTELARVQTDAQKQSFLKNGFTQYEFIVNGNCCDVCAAIAGKHFKVNDMQPGENAPPMHPYCRCSTAAYEDSEDYNAWLEYLDKGGTTEEYNKLKKAGKLNKTLVKNVKSDKIKSEKYNIEAGTKKIKESMGNDSSYKEFVGLVKNCKNTGIQKLYATVVDKISSIKKVFGRGEYKDTFDTLKYAFEDEKYEGKSKYSILLHELGHAFDHKGEYKNLHFNEIDTVNKHLTIDMSRWFKNRASFSDEFLTAVRTDKEAIKNSYFGKDNNYGENLKKELRPYHASYGVQDAIDGMFNFRIFWGHGPKYYDNYYSTSKQLDQHKNLQKAYKELGFDVSNQAKVKNIVRNYDTASEIWANMSSAVICGGDDLVYMKKYLPNSYKAFIEILKGVK